MTTNSAEMTADATERFEHRPTMFVGVNSPTLVYVGIADRTEFDRIAAPLIDNGENEHGHVLIKNVGGFRAGEVTVIFQHWLKSVTIGALIEADRRAQGAKPTEPQFIDDDREPTADESRGMDWWNSLTDMQRAFRLLEADTPADAWARYKRSPQGRAAGYG